MNEVGFVFKVLYRDVHLLKIRVSAWNHIFGGSADLYVNVEELGNIAAELQGFPRNAADTHDIVLGVFGAESAGGAVRMRFRSDRSGHIRIETEIESDHDSAGIVESAKLVVRTEPSAIDSFVDELRTVDAGATTTAYLRATQ